MRKYSSCIAMAAVLAAGGHGTPAWGDSWDNQSDARWHVTLGGFSHHARETFAPGREWQEKHSGLGLQQRLMGLPWSPGAGNEWRSRISFGTLEDSRGYLGSYGGLSVLRELTHFGPLRLEGGANAAMHYRSASWSGRMHVVPVLMPTLSLTEYRSGFGVDLSWVPPVRVGSSGGVSTLLLQLSYRVDN